MSVGGVVARGVAMQRILTVVFAVLSLLAPSMAAAQGTPPPEKRIALVIGNAAYQTGALKTAANDAGLIAQTLQAAGFDVVGARDLDQDSLRRTFRDFLEKAQATGPNTVAFVYVSGYGVQLEGENYIVPVDAKLARDTDIPVEAVRVSDYSRPLAALKLKASIVVLDAARPNAFAKSGTPLAGGLALMEPEPGMLIAFNAAPGTVAPDHDGAYGPYAQALAEMMRAGGLSLADVFDHVRLRVNDVTKGAEVPWHAAKVESQFVFFERAPDAPPPAAGSAQKRALRSQPIGDLGAQDAYIAALERDTLQGYQDFLATYPDDPMAKRVRAIIAARREAITWRKTRVNDTPQAYWSYLRRYPRGPHAGDCHRRLAFLAAAPEPPPSFDMIAYDVPPPPPEEIVYVEQPVLVFDDPVYAFAPPPPPPVYFLPPPPVDFVLLPPPPPPVALFVLPIPEYRPVPIWVRPPAYVAPPPPNNVIFVNVHNTVVINNRTNAVTVTNAAGQTSTMAPPAAPAISAGQRNQRGVPAPAVTPAALVGPALPPSVARKAASQPSQTPGAGQPSPSAQPGQATPRQLPRQSLGQPLPGASGQPLPTAPSVQSSRRPGQPAMPQTGATTQQKASTGTPTGSIAPQPTDRSKAPSAQTSPTPSTTKRPAHPVATRSEPPASPAAKRAPSPPPAAARRPSSPPPTIASRPAPPAAAIAHPPAMVRRPPPPVASRPAPPPPMAARPSPPPAAMRPAPPPAVARPAPAMAPRPAPARPACGGPGHPCR